jgi:hypothetical protein
VGKFALPTGYFSQKLKRKDLQTNSNWTNLLQ